MCEEMVWGKLEEGIKEAILKYSKNKVKILSEKYKFSMEEGMRYLNLDVSTEKKEKEKESVIVLPFCGVSEEKKCCGLKLNHGLYTQCRNDWTIVDEKNEIHFCKICSNQAKKNPSGQPTYGIIQDRLKVNALEFRDPKGKQVVPYGNVMEKLNITKENAIAAANKLGLTIAEEQFEVKKTKRGRPRKDTSTSDTESEASVAPVASVASVASEPKKRGRPKKDKQIVSSMAPGDDLIAALVAKAKETTPKESDLKEDNPEIKTPDVSKKRGRPKKNAEPPPKAPTPPPSDSEEEEEIEVKRFTHENVEYLKAGDNVLYNLESEVVGIWNEKTNEIDPAPEDNED